MSDALKTQKLVNKIIKSINKHTIMFIITGGFSLSLLNTPVYAFNYNSPDITTEKATLDSIKEKSISYIENHTNNYSISTTQNDGDLSINFNGTKYYFTPSNTLSETELTDLKNLVNTGNSSLIETTSDDAMYSFVDPNESANNKYFKYDTTKLPTSAISYATGTENDYTFKIEVPNADI